MGEVLSAASEIHSYTGQLPRETERLKHQRDCENLHDR